MNVIDHSMCGCWFIDIMILPRSRLPEATISTSPRADDQPLEEWRFSSRKIGDRFFPYGSLDTGQYRCHLIILIEWMDEQMNMLRHDYPCPKVELVSHARFFDRFD